MNSKSILFVNQSSGYLMIDIINAHVPDYSNIVLYSGYLNPRETPLHEKVKVIKGKKYDRTSSWRRFFSWIMFWLKSLYLIFVIYRNYNIYFVSNPPINIFAARWLKRPFAYLVYDIYPEALSRYSYLTTNSRLFKYWLQTNYKVYNKANGLFTISSAMKNAMLSCGVQEEKIKIVPIWTNAEFFKNIPPQDNIFLKQHKLQNKFIVGYSGNLGKSHPIERLLDLAEYFKTFEDILFLITGDGDKKSLLQKRKHALNLDNVKILGFQETDLFPQVLDAIHIGVITLDEKASDLNVPSKVYNLMSVGKPIIGISSKNSELAKLIGEHKIGENFNPNDIDGMISFILRLKNSTNIYQEMHQNSLKTSLKYTSKNAKKLILQ